jgi:hypothetical protein
MKVVSNLVVLVMSLFYLENAHASEGLEKKGLPAPVEPKSGAKSPRRNSLKAIIHRLENETPSAKNLIDRLPQDLFKAMIITDFLTPSDRVNVECVSKSFFKAQREAPVTSLTVSKNMLQKRSYQLRPFLLEFLAKYADDLTTYKKLTSLNLSGLAVTDKDLVFIVEHLPSLKKLDLENTDVTDADLSTLKELHHLEFLTLNSTPVTNAGLAHLEALPLKELSLSDTRITDKGLRHLSHLPLRVLFLNGTSITSEGLNHVGHHRLEVLGLANTRVTDAGIVKIKNRDLHRLEMGGTLLSDTGMAHLTTFKLLHTLSVGDTNVTGKGLVHVSALPLKNLYLNHIPVEDVDLIHLRLLPIEELDLSGTDITLDGLEHLRSLPLKRVNVKMTFMPPIMGMKQWVSKEELFHLRLHSLPLWTLLDG